MLSRTFKGCVLWYLLQKGLRESCLGVDEFVYQREMLSAVTVKADCLLGNQENAQDGPWRSVIAKTPCNVCFQQEASGHL